MSKIILELSAMMTKYAYLGEASFVTSTDIILPTFDTYSDVSLITSIALHGEMVDGEGIQWAFAMLIPIILNISFTM